MSIVWDIVSKSGEWLMAAHKTSKDRKMHRYTNLLRDAGVAVASLRRLDVEFHRIFTPLRYFAGTWDSERREAAVEEVVGFAYENVVTTRLVGALTALAKRSEDPELVDDGGIGVDLAVQAHLITGVALGLWHPDANRAERTKVKSWLVRLQGPGSRDEDIQERLPDLLRMIRTARTPEECWELTEAVNHLARDIYRHEDGSPPSSSPFRRGVEQAEEALGTMTVMIQQRFPQVPSPDWVWT